MMFLHYLSNTSAHANEITVLLITVFAKINFTD